MLIYDKSISDENENINSNSVCGSSNAIGYIM
jgi:hypothetical protein